MAKCELGVYCGFHNESVYSQVNSEGLSIPKSKMFVLYKSFLIDNFERSKLSEYDTSDPLRLKQRNCKINLDSSLDQLLVNRNFKHLRPSNIYQKKSVCVNCFRAYTIIDHHRRKTQKYLNNIEYLRAPIKHQSATNLKQQYQTKLSNKTLHLNKNINLLEDRLYKRKLKIKGEIVTGPNYVGKSQFPSIHKIKLESKIDDEDRFVADPCPLALSASRKLAHDSIN